MAFFNSKTNAFVSHVYWSSHKVHSFERLWSLPKNWFNTPNEWRGGWWGVTCTAFDTKKGKWRIRLIELEKLFWRFNSKSAMKPNLYGFKRRADNHWTHTKRLYFLKHYFNADKLTLNEKHWHKLDYKSYRELT